GAQVTGGSAGAWNVTLTGVSNTAGMVAGGWLLIWNAGAAQGNWSQTLLMGFFPIVSVAGSSVTVRNYYYAASWPSPLTTSGNMTVLTTLFWVNANTSGAGIAGAGISQLQYVGFISKGMANNIYASGLTIAGSNSSNFSRVGVNGWRNNLGIPGIGISAGGASLVSCASSNNGTGISISSSGATNLGLCGFTHNSLRGIWTEGGSVICSPGWPVQVGGNVEIGVVLNSNSRMIMQALA